MSAANKPFETKFTDVRDLARLPWFHLVDGRLIVDPDVGPSIDVHTHLALSYGPFGGPRTDLLRSSERTLTYFPSEGRPFDLDLYMNRNFSAEELKRLERDLTLGSIGCGGDGARLTHTVPNLAREMDDLGIRFSVLLPIEYPFFSRNAERWQAATSGRPDFVCFGSVHPFAPNVARRLDAQKAAGARGVKLHPAVQCFRPDMRRAIHVYRLCGERDLAVFFHCGPVGIEPALQRYLTQVRFYRPAIEACPKTTFVLGHTGALQVDEAIALARDYPNVWVEVASQSLPAIRKILASVPAERIMFGTDWPFYPQAIQLAKVLIASDNDVALRRKVLYANACRLLGVPDDYEGTRVENRPQRVVLDPLSA
jgi:predicted TIM-barrel fold metal-dependent hydrolase